MVCARSYGFSRTQESSADQAALDYLEKTGQSGRGLIEFFEILGDQELVPEKYRDPYASTHPYSFNAHKTAFGTEYRNLPITMLKQIQKSKRNSNCFRQSYLGI